MNVKFLNLSKYSKAIFFTFLLINISVGSTSCVSRWSRQIIEITNKLEQLPGKQELDIVFKKTPTKKLALDIYHGQSDASNRPVYVFIYGGAWIGGIKETVRVFEAYKNEDEEVLVGSTVKELNEKGITAVAISYRYVTETPMRNLLADVEDAFLFLLANKDKYKLDMENVVVHGQSAGAHLALLYSFTQANKNPKVEENIISRDNLLTSIKIKGIINEYGPTNLETLSEYYPVFSKAPFFNQFLKIVPRRHRNTYSPIHLTTSKSPDMLILHGEKDDIVPISQSTDLMLKLEYSAAEKFVFLPSDYDSKDLENRFIYYFFPSGDHGLSPRSIGEENFRLHHEIVVDYVVSKLVTADGHR